MQKIDGSKDREELSNKFKLSCFLFQTTVNCPAIQFVKTMAAKIMSLAEIKMQQSIEQDGRQSLMRLQGYEAI